MRSLTAVGSGDFSTFMASAVRFGEVEFSNVTTFVDNVLSSEKLGTLEELTVISHGDSYAVYFDGAEEAEGVGTWNFDVYRPKLKELAPVFKAEATLIFKNCEIGNSPKLLQLFADTLGVTVVGYTGKSWTAFAIPTGDRVEVKPTSKEE